MAKISACCCTSETSSDTTSYLLWLTWLKVVVECEWLKRDLGVGVGCLAAEAFKLERPTWGREDDGCTVCTE